jgi:hypothetical protein
MFASHHGDIRWLAKTRDHSSIPKQTEDFTLKHGDFKYYINQAMYLWFGTKCADGTTKKLSST